MVKYEGQGSAQTMGHGLGVAPACIIIKNIDASADWFVYHQSLGATKRLKLNQTVASATSTFINNTTPSSTVFNTEGGGASGTNGQTYVAYCFAEKTGYSKFGSYVGNGNANGPFIYTGFKPAFVMARQTNTTNNWIILDNKRDSFNPQDSSLYPNLSNAEDADGADYFDFYSNGMKVRTTNDTVNESNGTYIYMAFAEAPIVGTNNIPATAR